MGKVVPDNDAAVSFLKQWEPDGPWTLTCIDPDRNGLETRTFKNVKPLAKWLVKFNGTRNIYFQVNRLVRGMDGVNVKSSREDIKEIPWLHVDIDPRQGETPAQCVKRATTMLRKPPQKNLSDPKPLPPATVIVASGGGVQGFWRLEVPIRIDGDLAAAEDAKRYNQQIETIFQADACHNVDRIMRLPGTVNLPNDKKRRANRKPALAVLVEWNDTSYALADFVPAPVVQSGDSGLSRSRLDIGGDVTRVHDLDDLDQWDVPEKLKRLVMQGADPDDPTRYASRSEALFAACTGLIRSKVPDETIYALITDPDYGISSSVVDKGNAAHAYALRQIVSATEQVKSPLLRELNEKHVVIEDVGGKCRIASEVHDPTWNRTRLSFSSFEDLRNRYSNRKVSVGHNKGVEQFMPLGKWWLGHPMRNQCGSLVFAPGKEVPDAYNLWRGFACDATPGDCELFLDHVRDNVCGGDEKNYEYLLGWMARAVQHPDTPGSSAIVMRGRMGTGKSFFAKTFGALFGRHFIQVANADHVTGNFNAHLRDCVVMFADEALYAGDRRHEAVLKALVTEEHIVVEKKGVDAEVCPNYVHLIIASNAEWVVPAGTDDRRFLVLDVGTQKMQDSRYFAAIQAQLDTGGLQGLLHVLMSHPLEDYDVRTIPKTSALMDQKIRSMDPNVEWWFHKLWDGVVFGEDWPEKVRKDKLYTDYIDYARDLRVYHPLNKSAFGKHLVKLCPGGSIRSYQDKTIDGRRYFYDLPPLADARRYFDGQRGGPYKWPKVGDDGDPGESIPF